MTGGDAMTWNQSGASGGGQLSGWSGSTEGKEGTNTGGELTDPCGKASSTSSWNQSSKDIEGSDDQGSGWNKGPSSNAQAGGWGDKGAGSGDGGDAKTWNQSSALGGGQSSGWGQSTEVKGATESGKPTDPWGNKASTSSWGNEGNDGSSKGGW
jgi:hypothetical protein